MVIRLVVVVVLTGTPSLSLQPTVYDVMMPFLPSSLGRSQDNVTLLDPMVITEKESGCTVGAMKFKNEVYYQSWHLVGTSNKIPPSVVWNVSMAVSVVV